MKTVLAKSPRTVVAGCVVVSEQVPFLRAAYTWSLQRMGVCMGGHG